MNRGRQTTNVYQLDLTDEVWPVSLLKFKQHLDQLAVDQVLEVKVADPDVVDSLDKILRHAADRIIRIDKQSDCYRILIQRQDAAGKRT